MTQDPTLPPQGFRIIYEHEIERHKAGGELAGFHLKNKKWETYSPYATDGVYGGWAIPDGSLAPNPDSIGRVRQITSLLPPVPQGCRRFYARSTAGQVGHHEFVFQADRNGIESGHYVDIILPK